MSELVTKVKAVPEVPLWDFRVRSVPRQDVFILQDPSVLWFIRSGTAGVFSSQIESGYPVGRRRFLFRARAGDAVFSLVDGDSSLNRLLMMAAEEMTIVE